jgi:hypothetical protein
MSNITLGGPYPKCPVCEKGNLVPAHISEDGYITLRGSARIQDATIIYDDYATVFDSDFMIDALCST